MRQVCVQKKYEDSRWLSRPRWKNESFCLIMLVLSFQISWQRLFFTCIFFSAVILVWLHWFRFFFMLLSYIYIYIRQSTVGFIVNIAYIWFSCDHRHDRSCLFNILFIHFFFGVTNEDGFRLLFGCCRVPVSIKIHVKTR